MLNFIRQSQLSAAREKWSITVFAVKAEYVHCELGNSTPDRDREMIEDRL